MSGCFKKQAAKKAAANVPVQLVYYKLFDDEDVMNPLIAKFQATHPNISVRYRKFEDVEAYEDLLLNEMAEGEGPDIFPLFWGRFIDRRHGPL